MYFRFCALCTLFYGQADGDGHMISFKMILPGAVSGGIKLARAALIAMRLLSLLNITFK